MFAWYLRLLGLSMGVVIFLFTTETPLSGATFSRFEESQTASSWTSAPHKRLDLPRSFTEGREDSFEDQGKFDALKVAAQVVNANPFLSDREATRIGNAIIRYSEKYKLDPELVLAVVLVESATRPWARSSKGARGLMQVMPHMAKPLELAGHLNTIESNIEAGCIILSGNIRRLGEEDGISTYFWGQNIRGGGYFNRVEAARTQIKGFHSNRENF